MKPGRTKTFFFLLLSVCTVHLHAQKARQALETLSQRYPQEKVVLQFSKTDYLAGEILYFTAYVLTGYEPSGISTNLYAELYDKNKKLLDKHLFPLFNGSGEGFFALPASLAEDVYYVRAYTQYMLNFDEAFQCIKPVAVYNTASSNGLVKKPVQWSAQVFTEGGTLLNEVPSVLAVRLFATGRPPDNWLASLVEKESGAVVADVDALNDEVGRTRFLPMAGKTYAVRVKDDSGGIQTIDLPKASDTGTALWLNVKGAQLTYTVITKNIASKGEGYKLIGTLHEQFVFSALVKHSDGAVSGKIDVSALPAGVLRVTLFDEAERPLNERLCFLHQELQCVVPTVSIDTLSFAPKGGNEWSLKVDTTNWTSYAAQVIDAVSPFINTFAGDVYLSSDLPSVRQAYWYFEDTTETKRDALNALLLTETWKRFAWTDLLKDRYPVLAFYPDNYLSYKGTVHKGKKLQPRRDVNLILQGKGLPMHIVQVKTDSTGRFRINDAVFADTVNVYYQAASRKFLEGDVEIDFETENRFRPYKRSFPPSLYELKPRTAADTVPAHIRRAEAQRTAQRVLREKENMMQEVVIRARAKPLTEELDKRLSSGFFSSADAVLFDFIHDDQTSALGYTNILNWLQGRLPGYRTDFVNGQPVPFLRGSPAQIYLDEVPVDPAVLNSVSASDIALIKVIRGVFAGGRGNGAIAVYTRRGDMSDRLSTPSLPNNVLIGYAQVPAFFSPDYSRVPQDVPDQRDVLFRSTSLYPADERQKASIRFFNNDGAKAYRLVVTGFTGDGKPVFLNKVFRQ